MKHLLLALGLLGTLVASAGAFTISGQVTGVNMPAAIGVIAFEVATGTPSVGVANLFNGNYSFSDLTAGGYILFAYNEQNANFLPDLEEPRGFYGGQVPEILQLQSDTANIAIVLEPPSTGGFTGSVSYSGTQTGRTMIMAFYPPALSGFPHGGGFLLTQTGNGPYTAPVDSFTTYYAVAFMDLNSNLQPDADEPFGIYGGDAPVEITVTETDFPDGINIAMTDPNAVSAPRPLPQELGLGAYPNPFNSATRIRFTLPVAAPVTLRLYDLQGREIRTLARGSFTAGAQELLVDSQGLSSGEYFVRLITPTHSEARPLFLLR